MKDIRLEERVQVGLAPDTREFIASASGLGYVDSRRRLLLAALDISLCMAWGYGPERTIDYILEGSASEAGIEREEFDRIVAAATAYTMEHASYSARKLPPELAALTWGGNA